MAKKNEVSDIKVNVKRPNRRSVYINGEYAFSISEGIFLEQGITVGDTLTYEQIQTLISADEREKIRNAALNLLSYRQRSVHEIRGRLRRKGWADEEVDSVIGELEEKGYLNDGEFARAWARERVQRKSLGPLGLRQELIKAGVDRELIEEVIDETYRENSTRSLIETLLKKRKIDAEKPISAKEKSRLVNLLKRKGYNWSDIEPVISKLIVTKQDDD